MRRKKRSSLWKNPGLEAEGVGFAVEVPAEAAQRTASASVYVLSAEPFLRG
jgi:hypothetical protein